MTKETKKLVVGILAHVDAGKTTLAESLLYLGGSIRKLGRVDHKDAFLDTFALERERGITIFSKQAEFKLGECEITLLDTPGHVDFSAEMERTLQVLDYAILVISGADGVQGHVQTLWRLLKRYQIPVFLFINKMDQYGTDKESLLQELCKKLDERCVDFSAVQDENFYETIAMCDESFLENYLEYGRIEKEEIIRAIANRKVFPCYFGSALKIQGVESFMQGFGEYTCFPTYGNAFGAKVFKIARDEQGNRLTYLKVTGGSLKVKMLLSNKGREIVDPTEVWEEKVDQIRIYSGAKYNAVEEVFPGTICAVTGLSKSYSGQGFGVEKHSELPMLQPVLTYQIQLPAETNVHRMFLQLKQLEEEEPQLHIIWDEKHNEIHAQVMGDVQIDILKHMILNRFGVEVSFGSGSIVYKETILEPVEGIGHFEPLRHYAEVHLLLEPLKQGSGLQFETNCSEDMLDKNWQRLILTHLEEKKHVGVLTGSEITDMRITLVAGRAHLKHTEGGDFRQATYRAVRQGLKKAKSVLLEPVYDFRLEIPTEVVGRALTDIQKMQGNFAPPVIEGEMSILTGSAPVVTMRGYQREVIAYTRGHGSFHCTLKGYEPCHNEEEVIASLGYDSEVDLDHPTGSVFCSHGAGFVVSWDRVEEYMHVESPLKLQKSVKSNEVTQAGAVTSPRSSSYLVNEKELEEIFERTYGPTKKDKVSDKRRVETVYGENKKFKAKKETDEKEYLLVDGYNIIFAWDELSEIAEINMDAARNVLMDILSNFQGYKKYTIILVFDAYKVEGNKGEIQKYHNIYVVYTREAETADQYIEKTVHEIGRKYKVTVATSDALEQVIIWGQGAGRLSAKGLKEEIEAVQVEIRSNYLNKEHDSKNYLFQYLSDEMAEMMENVRLGKSKFTKNKDK